jgi:hypothetical protein
MNAALSPVGAMPKVHCNASTVVTPEMMADIEEFRGTFEDGHTDDDVRSVLGDIERICGAKLVVVWSFNDCWGLGGDSEIHAMDSKGRVCELLGEWSEFLFQPGNEVTAEALSGPYAGKVVPHWERIHSEDEYNLFRRRYDGEAPN